MTIKLSAVLKINNILKTIIDNTDLKIDSLFKFKLLGIMKEFEIPISNFELIKNEKIREYGTETEDENGEKNISISKDDTESMNKFTNDISKVLNSDIDIDINTLKPDDVFNKGLPAEYLVGLYPIIEE